MLSDKQLHRYADVLLWGLKTARTGAFKKNDIILIRYDRPATRLAEILYARILEKGMNPVQRMTSTTAMEISFFELSDSRQLVFQPPGDMELFQSLNGGIFLHAPESITHLGGIDPKRIGKATIARKPLRDILDSREEQGLFGWTLCMCPTEELARHAGLTLEEYASQIVKACFLNRRCAVDQWQEIYKNASSIKKWLNSMEIKSLKVESKSIDLVITPGNARKWIGISGHNIPSFEIFLSPDWKGTKGVYYADMPSYRSGNYVEKVRLEFRNGSVIKAEAAKGQDFLRKQIAMDKGANKVGEFSLTDKRFSRISTFMANTLFDENYGGKNGNCHLALGASYSDTYAGNPAELTKDNKKELGFNDSALHWDLVNTEAKQVTARLESGKILTIYENGKFAY